MRSRSLQAVVVAAALCGGCGPKDDPVRAWLDAMVEAANARDAKALFARVASGFQGADGSGVADARAMVGRYFAAYDRLAVSIRDVRIERGDAAARVRLRAEMSGTPRKIGGLEGLVPPAAAYDFDLRLTQEAGQWKVAWAEWNPAGGAQP